MSDTSTPLEAEPLVSASPARTFQSDALKRLLQAAAEREQQGPAIPQDLEPEFAPEPQASEPAVRRTARAAPARAPVPLTLALAFVAFVSAVAVWLLLFSN